MQKFLPERGRRNWERKRPQVVATVGHHHARKPSPSFLLLFLKFPQLFGSKIELQVQRKRWERNQSLNCRSSSQIVVGVSLSLFLPLSIKSPGWSRRTEHERERNKEMGCSFVFLCASLSLAIFFISKRDFWTLSFSLLIILNVVVFWSRLLIPFLRMLGKRNFLTVSNLKEWLKYEIFYYGRER